MIVCLALLTLVALNSCDAMILNPSPVNGAVISKCSGSDVILPWTYSLSSQNKVQMIMWFFNKELAAMYTFKHLETIGDFKGRVKRIVNGNSSQLMIQKVTEQDSGIYTIRIQGVSANSSFTLTRTLTLEVKDGLEMSDRKLHVSQKPSPVWDAAKSRWSVQLECGNFLYNQTPHFDVQWLNPSGNITGSTGYQNGTFFLLLPSTMEGGNYTCRLSKQAPNACLSEDVEATLTVDSQNAPLAALDLSSVQKQQQEDYETLSQQLQEQKSQNRQLQNQMKTMNQQLQDEMKVLKQRLQEQINELNHSQTLMGQNNKGGKSMMVSFYAGQLPYPMSFKKNNRLIMINVYHNRGNGYNNNTGIFTAPVNGCYCFLASSGPKVPNRRAGFHIMQGKRALQWVSGFDSGDKEVATGHVVLHLIAGDTVWLRAGHSAYYWSAASAFSGFLIDEMP